MGVVFCGVRGSRACIFPSLRAPVISTSSRANCSDIPICNQYAPKLIVGHLYVLEVGLADCLANNAGDFGVGDVALSQEFTGLFAAENWVQEVVGCCGSDVARGDHGKLQVRTERSGDGSHLADRVHLGSVFSMKYPARR